MRRIPILIALAGSALFAAEGPLDLHAPEIKLWPNGAPGSEGKTAPERWIEGATPDAFHRVTDIHNPSITVFLPPRGKANGAAFIVAPGGGHRYLVMDLEGKLVAERLNAMGIAAFVLKSRLANAQGSTYKIEGESLADTLRAIRLVRSRGKEWGVDPARVGVMGFSAGGQLALLAENRFDAGRPDASDPVERVSSRPDFAVLGYPGVREWKTPVEKTAPPTFIYVNDDDPLATGAGQYYLELRKAKITSEFHVFRRGGHGVGMTGRSAEFQGMPESKWPDLLEAWLGDIGVLKK